MSNGRGIEARAAAAVAHALNARAVRRDLGGQQARDFDLLLPDGTVEPLEITIAADEIVRRTWARIEQLDRDAPSLTNAWTLDVPNTTLDRGSKPAPFTARDFLVQAEPLLRELEAAGISEFNPTTLLVESAEQAVRGLLSLGCDLGMSHPVATGETGRIHLTTGIGGWVDPDLVAEAIEEEAAKPDNRAKLSEPADARRRHLCVIIDASTGATLSAGAHGNLGRLPHAAAANHDSLGTRRRQRLFDNAARALANTPRPGRGLHEPGALDRLSPARAAEHVRRP